MAEDIKTPETKEETAEPEKKPEQPSVKDLEAEIARLKAENEKQKASISRANADAADWKRQLRDKQTEAEREAAERAEHEKAREARIAELEAKERVHNYKNKLLEAAVDPASADAMANALPDGVSDDYFATLKSYLTQQRQNIETAKLNNQPGLSVGLPPVGQQKSAEDIMLDKIFGLT